MIKKYHNRTLQTNPRHHEEEPQNINNYNASGSNQLFKMIAKLERTQSNG